MGDIIWKSHRDHGSIFGGKVRVPRDTDTNALLETLAQKLTDSSLCKKWKNDFGANKAVHVDLTYYDKKQDLHVPTNFRWLRYQADHAYFLHQPNSGSVQKVKYVALKSQSLIKRAREIHAQAKEGKVTLNITIPPSFPKYAELHASLEK